MNECSADYLARFGGVARLYGSEALAKLARAHFAIVGLGGVGAWAAEALARSGIGELTLIELDDVCVTNTNRQAHALSSTVGQPKNSVVGHRLKDINPEMTIHSVHDFLDKKNMRNLIGEQTNGKKFDIVIDAIDSAYIKAPLAAYCSALKLRLVMCGSSGGKRDPRHVQIADLGRTSSDPMLAKVRTQLYRKYNFKRDNNRKFRIDTVFSTEQMVYPKPDGSVCMDKQALQGGVKLDCTSGFGSSVMVTGTFGFMAASRAIERYLGLPIS